MSHLAQFLSRTLGFVKQIIRLVKEERGTRDIGPRAAELTVPLRRDKIVKFELPQNPKLDDAVRELLGAIRGLESNLNGIVAKAKLNNIGEVLDHVSSEELREKFNRVAGNLMELLS